jgi:hypothetical protein
LALDLDGPDGQRRAFTRDLDKNRCLEINEHAMNTRYRLRTKQEERDRRWRPADGQPVSLSSCPLG